MCKQLFKSRISLILIIPLIILLINVVALVYTFLKKECPNPTECYSYYLQKGVDYHGQEQHDLAIQAFKKALQFEPNSFVPTLNIGTSYGKKGNFKMAEEYFKKAAVLEPAEFVIYYKLFELYFYDLRKNPGEMEPFFKDAIVKTNNNINVFKIYGRYLEEINDPENALIIWKEILKLDPQNQLYLGHIKELEQKSKVK